MAKIEGVFVDKAWIGKTVVIELDMPAPMPTSDLTVAGPAGQAAQAASMGIAFPEIECVLLADLPEGLIVRTKNRPQGYAIMKGKIFGVYPVEGSSDGILIS